MYIFEIAIFSPISYPIFSNNSLVARIYNIKET